MRVCGGNGGVKRGHVESCGGVPIWREKREWRRLGFLAELVILWCTGRRSACLGALVSRI